VKLFTAIGIKAQLKSELAEKMASRLRQICPSKEIAQTIATHVADLAVERAAYTITIK